MAPKGKAAAGSKNAGKGKGKGNVAEEAKGGGNKGKGKGKGKAKGDTSEEGKGGAKLNGAQSIHVWHILCEKEKKKNEALAKLNSGAKFDEVAKEFSEDKARAGGKLGWKQKGDLLPEFAQEAFKAEVSTTGDPKCKVAKTEHGYHIIMVDDRR